MALKNNLVIVCAYHNVGYCCISELLRQGAEIALIFTYEDSPEEEIWFSSVREIATRHNIPYITTDISRLENVELVKKIAPDFILSFYYRNIIKPEVLKIPRLGALNLHGSFLPFYRGRAPVNWAVINGEIATGATLHYMVEKADAGDIVDQEKIAIEFTDTAYDVFGKVTDAAVTIIGRTWPLLRENTAARIPMNLKSGNYCGGRKPADGQINWYSSAIQIYNLIRGVAHPYPGAFTFLNGRKIIIWKAWPRKGLGEPGRILSQNPLLAGTGDGLLEVISLQADGDTERVPDEFAQQNPGGMQVFGRVQSLLSG